MKPEISSEKLEVSLEIIIYRINNFLEKSYVIDFSLIILLFREKFLFFRKKFSTSFIININLNNYAKLIFLSK